MIHPESPQPQFGRQWFSFDYGRTTFVSIMIITDSDYGSALWIFYSNAKYEHVHFKFHILFCNIELAAILLM